MQINVIHVHLQLKKTSSIHCNSKITLLDASEVVLLVITLIQIIKPVNLVIQNVVPAKDLLKLTVYPAVENNT